MTKIENLTTIDNTLSYLMEKLNWPISEDSPYINAYDATWEYYPEDLGLKDSDFAKVASLQQMKPLKENQDWAVFFVEFDYKKMQITVLRKILGSLIFNKRGADHKVWSMENLLFVCFWGSEKNRTIGFVHFNQSVKTLPTLKALYFEPQSESKEKLAQYEGYLSHLKWEYCEKCDAWTTEWKKAFQTEYGQVIRDTARLTKELARSAQTIRKQILDVLEVENENGFVHKLLKKFKDNLVHDMDEKSFADMYAQTICYGLFSARCLSVDSNAELNSESKSNEALNQARNENIFEPIKAIDNIPDTNPFLRQLLKEGLDNQKKNAQKSISFDELELNSIVDLLQNTDIQSIVKEFNRQTRLGYEDPVIHFYEDFLSEYDKEAKIDRGVFYTPLPVVNFIVRSVDHILKTEFGVAGGLACGETYPVLEGKGKNQSVHNIHKVQILDPATGTGTFLRQTILQIKKNFDEKNQNLSKEELAKEWNKYVILSLLHRMYGFELMMAPYAVAHMKLAMALKDTGYNFESKSRLKVFLTNSLEEPGDSSGQQSLFEEDAIAVEAIQANAVKKDAKINVVMGNPPYSGESSNQGIKWIEDLMQDYKKEPGGKEKLKEKNPKWINADEYKFLRFAQYYVEKNGRGILAYICPCTFVDGVTFRGMRWNLAKHFDKIYILNLHGNAKKNETAPDGSKDENVFPIQQGVSINIFIKNDVSTSAQNDSHCDEKSLAEVYYADCYGTKQSKFDFLMEHTLETVKFEKVELTEPYYSFVKIGSDFLTQNDNFFRMEDLFSVNGVGICSKRDTIAYQTEKDELISVLKDFKNLDEKTIKEKYNVTSESRDQKVSFAKSNIVTYGIKDEFIKQCLCRPFDNKWTYYTDKVRGFLAYPVYDVLRHMIKPNYALIISRQGAASDLNEWNVIFIADTIVDLNIFRRGGGCVFPLYLYDEGYSTRRANLNEKIVSQIAKTIGMEYKEPPNQVRGDGFTDSSELECFRCCTRFDSASYFTPLTLLDYIYAVLHTPGYRKKYKEFLKIDFPRIPYPKDKEQFLALAKLGGELRALHLMKSPVIDESPVVFCGGGVAGVSPAEGVAENAVGGWSEGETSPSQIVTTRKWEIQAGESTGKVWINKTEYFEGVPASAWNFYIGGYQVADKWLKDRKDRSLSANDILHYKRIIKILMETERIMQELDTVWKA